MARGFRGALKRQIYCNMISLRVAIKHKSKRKKKSKFEKK